MEGSRIWKEATLTLEMKLHCSHLKFLQTVNDSLLNMIISRPSTVAYLGEYRAMAPPNGMAKAKYVKRKRSLCLLGN